MPLGLCISIRQILCGCVIIYIYNKVHCFIWLDNSKLVFDTLCECTILTTVTKGLGDHIPIQELCQPVVKAYNENMESGSDALILYM